jgi:hypothetical protein
VIVRVSTIFLLCACIAPAETISTHRLTCEVAQTAEVTTLTAKAKGNDRPIVFRIDWKNNDYKAEGFKPSKPKGGAITSTHRLGKTTVTRTILASAAADCILIHVVADQPGAVSLSARFISEKPATIQNRREIIFSGEGTSAHAWIIPFESDVSDDEKATITLSGEGEALIILNLTTDPAMHPVSSSFTSLGEKYDPGHTPPNPHLIWEGIQEERVRERVGEGEKD